ncbi:hypothetical protein HMPREF1136_0188 [Actinomyces sp. ICM47]|nr:hypothetical protein HMPREF1136_0188 [Actinomyces sp. ICM47]
MGLVSHGRGRGVFRGWRSVVRGTGERDGWFVGIYEGDSSHLAAW